MRARDLVRALKPLEGKTAAINVYAGGPAWEFRQCIVRVRILPPRERRDGAGNVILESGEVGADGAPGGITMWARNVDTVEVDGERFVLRGTHACGLATVIITPEEDDDADTC